MAEGARGDGEEEEAMREEERKREMNTPICVTVGQLYDVEILKCFDMIFFL